MRLQYMTVILIYAAICLFTLAREGRSIRENLSDPSGSGPVIELFNGKNLDGWEMVPWMRTTADPHNWAVFGEAVIDPARERYLDLQSGTGILANGSQGQTSNLVSKYQHGDAYLHIEFMVPGRSNSGVYFQGLYEIQIVDSYGRPELRFSDCGGIYARWRNGEAYEGHAPRVNASKPAGEWQSFDVLFRAPRFDEKGKKVENARFVLVVHNGQIIHQEVEVTGGTREALERAEAPTGPLMLQGDHGPIAFRNIRLVPVQIDFEVTD